MRTEESVILFVPFHFRYPRTNRNPVNVKIFARPICLDLSTTDVDFLTFLSRFFLSLRCRFFLLGFLLSRAFATIIDSISVWNIRIVCCFDTLLDVEEILINAD